MQKNPIVPFILIFAFGIGLIFFLSIMGVEKKEEIAKGHDEGKAGTEEVTEFDPEVAKGKCIGCHGGDLTGGAGPALVGTSLSKEEITETIVNGKGAGMPAGLLPEDQAAQMAEYILTLK
jgi:cytochrome c550